MISISWPDDNCDPQGLDLDTIEALHPDPKGHVVFMRKTDGGGMKTVTSIKVGDLRATLPGLFDQLLKDSYCTVNTFREPHRDRGCLHYRTTPMLRSLMACYADLDFYKLGMDFSTTYARLHGMVANAWLPWPSAVARSGRGMYVLWLLKPPCKATPHNRELYGLVQDRIGEVLRQIGSDPNARDACRILRTPGSTHTAAQRRVKYILSADDAGVLDYGLDELFDLVSLPVNLPDVAHLTPTPKAPAVVPELNARPVGEPLPEGSLTPDDLPPSNSPEKRPAYARILDLARIAEARGGIGKGCRHFYLWRYAQALAILGITDHADLYARVEAMNFRACRPPQRASEVRAACQQIKFMLPGNNRVRQVRSERIARELGVTAQEARALGLRSIMPTEERQRRRLEREAKVKARKERKAADVRMKQRRLSQIIDEHQRYGLWPGRELLAQELGVHGVTLTKWARAMGYRWPTRGRPRSRRGTPLPLEAATPSATAAHTKGNSRAHLLLGTYPRS